MTIRDIVKVREGDCGGGLDRGAFKHIARWARHQYRKNRRFRGGLTYGFSEILVPTRLNDWF